MIPLPADDDIVAYVTPPRALRPTRTREASMIEVICGPMFAGKSTELLRRAERLRRGGQRVLVVSPAVDTRAGADMVQTHDGATLPCVRVAGAEDLRDAVMTQLGQLDAVCVDEVQFFQLDVLPVLREIAWCGVRVICAGLDLDWAGEPFPLTMHLLAVAEKVKKLSAVCSCGADAAKSYRRHASTEQVVVGGADAYEARCTRCWEDGHEARAVAY
jgi:thymidine kinase